MKRAIALLLLASMVFAEVYVATQAESTINYNVAGQGKNKSPPKK